MSSSPQPSAATEQVALVDPDGTPAGGAPRRDVRRDNLLHAATAVLVRDSRQRIYVHRRTASKDWAPSHWDAAAGGVLRAGEDPLAGAERELEEELGVSGVRLTPLITHLYQDAATRCFEHAYEVVWDGEIRHQPEEVAEGRWLAMEDLAQLQQEQPFVPDTAQLLGVLADGAVGDYAQLRVFAALRTLGLGFAVTRHGRVSSLAEAATARGLEPHRVVKTMVVRVSAEDHRMVLVPGDREIAWPRLRELVGVNRLTMADADEARRLTGFARGTITPFGAGTPLPVIADASLTGPVSLGAGAHGVAVTVEAEGAFAALDATVFDVTG